MTRRADGWFAVAIWNLSPPTQTGKAQAFDLSFEGATGIKHAEVYRIDASHANTLAAYARMGKPPYPAEAEVRQLNEESARPPPEKVPPENGQLVLKLPVNGLALLELRNEGGSR